MVSLMSNFMPAVQRLALSNLQVQEARLAFERMHEFAEIEPEYKEQPLEPVAYHNFAASGIAFSFPGRPHLLKDISFSISKKEHIVFLGESGSGKSTLLQLIRRFYQPSAGEFLLNNEPISGFPIPVSRELIAAVPQDVKLFNATLFENIILGNKAGLDQVVAFSRQMGFDHYFSAFPQGYASLLGAGGLQLSGGQKQLVALARALFRKPKLLLLDEATSAMDSNMAAFVERMLRALLTEGLSIITVTHQPAVASKADKVYVLEQGIISYEGTYHEWLVKERSDKTVSNN
ncbi:putative multidrug export ATP-binding/permease protein [compost metagenome]